MSCSRYFGGDLRETSICQCAGASNPHTRWCQMGAYRSQCLNLSDPLSIFSADSYCGGTAMSYRYARGTDSWEAEILISMFSIATVPIHYSGGLIILARIQFLYAYVGYWGVCEWILILDRRSIQTLRFAHESIQVKYKAHCILFDLFRPRPSSHLLALFKETPLSQIPSINFGVTFSPSRSSRKVNLVKFCRPLPLSTLESASKTPCMVLDMRE